MAGTNREARLNLVITARDEAKQVVEGLVTSLNEAFDGLGAKLVEKMGMNDLKDAVTSATTPIKDDLKSISTSLKTTGEDASSASKSIKTAMDGTKDAVNDLKTPFTSDMAEMVAAIKRVETEFSAEAREAKSASTEIEAALNQMKDAATPAAESIKGDTQKIVDALDKVSTKASDTKRSIDFANLQIAGQQIQEWGDSVVGFFEHAADSAADFDQNIHNTIASLDFKLPDGLKITQDQIQQLVDTSEKYGTEGFFPANKIAEGMSVLANQGMSFAGIMGGTIQTVHDVAAANQQDFADTANVMTDISNEMKEQLTKDALKTSEGQAIMTSSMSDSEKQAALVASQMPKVGDSMTAALHSGRMTMQDFLTTMKYVGPQAGALGVDFGDLAASIALLTQHGIKGSQAGTGLRRELTNLIPQSKDAAAAMKAMGLSADGVTSIFFDQEGNIRGLTDVQHDLHAAMSKLTPVQQEVATKAIFGQYALAAMTVTAHESPDAFKKLSEQMHQTGITTEILAEKKNGLLIIMNSVKNTFDTLTKKIGEDFKPQIIAITNFLQGLMDKWDKLNPSTRKTIETIALGVGAFMAIGGAVFAFIGTIGMLLPGVVEAGALIAGLAAPIGIALLVIAAIGLAVVGLHAAWVRDFGGIQEKTQVAMEWVSTQVHKAMDAVTAKVSAAVTELKKWWDDHSASFEKAIRNVWDVIKWLQPLWEGIWNVIKDTVKVTFDLVVDVIKASWAIISGVFDLFMDLLALNWKGTWNDILTVVNGIFDLIMAAVQAFRDLVTDLWGDLWTTIENLASKAGESLLSAVSEMFTNVESKFNAFIGGAYNWGANLIDMFVSGISATVHKVEDAISNVADKVKDFLGFHSPTKQGPASDSDTWMPNMMTMLTSGIVEHTPKIEAAVGNVALGLKTSMTSTNVTNAAFTSPTAPSSGRQINVYINVDGRSARTDDALAEKIAQQFRTQITMAV